MSLWQSAAFFGRCAADLQVMSDLYKSFKFSVPPNLCTDVILGQDLMKLHQYVEFMSEGPKSKLTACSATYMNLRPLPLFSRLLPDKPIATSTKHHSSSDEAIIQKEIQDLL